MRITKEQAARLKGLRRDLEAARAQVRLQFSDAMAEMHGAVSSVNAAVAEYNALLAQSRSLVDDVSGDIESAIENKSERWRESDAGQAAQALLDEWQAPSLTDAEDVRLVLPDAPEMADELAELPEESE